MTQEIQAIRGADWTIERVDDRLTTDRIGYVRRNVLSILQRLCPDVRLPAHFEILTWVADGAPRSMAEDGPDGGVAEG